MRKLITLWLLLISSFSFAQTWEGGLSNALQRLPTSKGYNYRFNLGSGKGVLPVNSSLRDDSLYKLPIGLLGQQFKISVNNTNTYAPVEPLNYGQFIYTDAQRDSAFNLGSSSQLKVFNTFKRFSHGGDPDVPSSGGVNDNLPGQPSQVASWSYDTTLNAIKSTFNTGSVIGFESGDQKFDNYVHRVTLSSSDSDNDVIGIVLAFVEDPNHLVPNRALHMNLPGVDTSSAFIPDQHVLELFRNRNGVNGFTGSYAIYYDYSKTTQKLIANGSGLSGLFSPTTGWNNNSVDVQATRTGDTIRVLTSNYSDASGGKGSLRFPITINLNSDTTLYKFKGKQSYGYLSHSQANSIFTNIYFSGSINVIYDLRNGNTYSFTGSSYVLDTTRTMYGDLGVRFLWRNPTFHTFGYVFPDQTYDVIMAP